MRPIEQRAILAYWKQFREEPLLVASAPGRVNLIGEHTDYNGGFVLPCAIDRRVAVAVGNGGGQLYSANFREISPLLDGREGSWADYPSGVAWAMREQGYEIPLFRGAFVGDVPPGSGLSSSAAIEAATALALDACFQLGVSRKDLALMCQRAENAFVGVQSGIMDQYASLLCREGSALCIDCRSLEAEPVPLSLVETGLSLFICDTQVARELGATGYNDRRETCERAASRLGIRTLRDAGMKDLEKLSGEECRRARHVITENVRVLEAVKTLRVQDLAAFGRLMIASHRSLRDDYAVSTPELDTFVDVAVQFGALGARLTGAGFGGCALALIKQEDVQALSKIVLQHFKARGFRQPVLFVLQPAAGAEVGT